MVVPSNKQHLGIVSLQLKLFLTDSQLLDKRWHPNSSCEESIGCSILLYVSQEYPCPGLCGEPCPFLCPDCDMPRQISSVQDIPDVRISEGMKWIYMTDCKHFLPVRIQLNMYYTNISGWRLDQLTHCKILYCL